MERRYPDFEPPAGEKSAALVVTRGCLVILAAVVVLALALACCGCAGKYYNYALTMTAEKDGVVVTDSYGVSSPRPLTTQDVLASFEHGLNQSLRAPKQKRLQDFAWEGE